MKKIILDLTNKYKNIELDYFNSRNLIRDISNELNKLVMDLETKQKQTKRIFNEVKYNLRK